MLASENPEELLQILERYTKQKPKDIPRELDEYLSFVAKTGDPVYRWSSLQYLFREKLNNVIKEFHDTTPSIEDLPQCPNVDAFNYESLKASLLERLELFHSAPFTIQRLCELLTDPKKHYNRLDKFMRALEKNILVVSTVEPGRRSTDVENGDSINGAVDINVDVDINRDTETIVMDSASDKQDTSESINVSEVPSSASSEVVISEKLADNQESNEVNVDIILLPNLEIDKDEQQETPSESASEMLYQNGNSKIEKTGNETIKPTALVVNQSKQDKINGDHVENLPLETKALLDRKDELMLVEKDITESPVLEQSKLSEPDIKDVIDNSALKSTVTKNEPTIETDKNAAEENIQNNTEEKIAKEIEMNSSNEKIATSLEITAIEKAEIEKPDIEIAVTATSSIETTSTETTPNETAAIETVAIESASTETPVIEEPVIEEPVIEELTIETAVVETTAIEIPDIETPVSETSASGTIAVSTTAKETISMETTSIETIPTESIAIEILASNKTAAFARTTENTVDKSPHKRTIPTIPDIIIDECADNKEVIIQVENIGETIKLSRLANDMEDESPQRSPKKAKLDSEATDIELVNSELVDNESVSAPIEINEPTNTVAIELTDNTNEILNQIDELQTESILLEEGTPVRIEHTSDIIDKVENNIVTENKQEENIPTEESVAHILEIVDENIQPISTLMSDETKEQMEPTTTETGEINVKDSLAQIGTADNIETIPHLEFKGSDIIVTPEDRIEQSQELLEFAAVIPKINTVVALPSPTEEMAVEDSETSVAVISIEKTIIEEHIAGAADSAMEATPVVADDEKMDVDESNSVDNMDL